MNQNIDLEKVEKKVYMAYHKDGLWDIFLGILLLWFGIDMLTGESEYIAVFIPILILGVMSTKKSFTLPRLGYAKFSPERKAKEKKAKSKLVVLFSFIFLAGLVAFWGYMGGSDIQQLIQDLELIPFGAVLALSVGVIGALLGIYRFITYGVLIIVLFVAGHIWQTDPPAYIMILGMIFLIYGFILMIRFMKKYPKPKNDGLGNELQ